MAAFVIIVAVVSIQTASGTAWWSYARRSRTISVFEALGMGLALGTFASMISAMALARTPLDPIAWALPAVATAVGTAIAAARGRLALAAVRWDVRQGLAVLVGVAIGLVLLTANWSRVPLGRPATASYTDLYFFEALSRGLAEFGPGQSILMSGGALRYHWFTYAWAGELAQTSSAASFVTITRVLPLVTLVGVSMLAAAWSARLSRVRWVPVLAVLLIVAGGYAGALYGSILNFDSPSQTMTTLWLMGLSVAFLTALHQGSKPWVTLVIVAALASACTGGKVSHAVVAACGIAVTMLVGLVARAPWWPRAMWAGIAAAAAMAVTYVWVLSGVALDRNLTEEVAVKASTWQGLDPFVGRLGVALGTVALLLAILARLSGLGWMLVHPRTRLRPDTLFGAGAVLCGIVVMLLLSEGVNELWFVLAASAPAAVLSAAGVGRALRSARDASPRLRRPLVWAVIVTVPAAVASLVLSANWTTHRAPLNWLSPVSIWLLVPAAAVLVVVVLRVSSHRLRTVVALTVAGLALASIATRPASLWTSSRPITTEGGGITPTPDLPATAAPSTAATPTPDDEYSLVVSAADWLSAHASRSDLVATTNPLSARVPALTGNQMYLAGDIYQVGLGRADELPVIEQRRTVSASLADGVGQTETALLCAEGVRWVWFDGPPKQAAQSTIAVAFANQAVSILTVPEQACEADSAPAAAPTP